MNTASWNDYMIGLKLQYLQFKHYVEEIIAMYPNEWSTMHYSQPLNDIERFTQTVNIYQFDTLRRNNEQNTH